MSRIMALSISKENDAAYTILQEWKRDGINASDEICKFIIEADKRRQQEQKQKQQAAGEMTL